MTSRICRAAIVAAVVLAGLTKVRADGLDFFAEYTYDSNTAETKDENTGTTVHNDSHEFRQRYNATLSKAIYPALLFRAGGLAEFDRLNGSADSGQSVQSTTLLRPFAELDLGDQMLSAGVIYRTTKKSESGTEFSEPSFRRDEYVANLQWNPAILSHFDAGYSNYHTFDDVDAVDKLEQLLSLHTRFNLQNLFFNYTYIADRSDDRKQDFSTLRTVHDGKANYSCSWFGGRLSLFANYALNSSSLGGSGQGSAKYQLYPIAGLAGNDNTPQDGPALTPNLALIDGDRSDSTGIDLGWGGDKTTLAEIGLEFEFPGQVDTFYVWVDRTLPTSVAAWFEWSLYTSPDNTDASVWTLVGRHLPAIFGAFDNRFEISVPQTEARYMKLVTRPLQPSASTDPQYQAILVTELESYTTLTELSRRVTTSDQNWDASISGKLGPQTMMSVSSSYRLERNSLFTSNDKRLSNAINFSHTFNDTFSYHANVSREDSRLESAQNIHYNYASTLKANYLESFWQTLSYSGATDDESGARRKLTSWYLRSNATLYTGCSLDVNLGFNRELTVENEWLNSQFLSAGMNLTPSDWINLEAFQSLTRYATTPDSATANRVRAETELSLFATPSSLLSFFAGLTRVNSGNRARLAQNYSLNWSPFPYGAMQVFIIYDERLSNEDQSRDRIASLGARYELNKRAQLETSYKISNAYSTFETDSSGTMEVKLTLKL